MPFQRKWLKTRFWKSIAQEILKVKQTILNILPPNIESQNRETKSEDFDEKPIMAVRKIISIGVNMSTHLIILREKLVRG